MAFKENSGPKGQVFQDGRGLSAFLARLNFGRAAGNSDVVPLSEISPDPEQPRKKFSEPELAELAASIKIHGLLQPLIVAPAPEGEAAKYRIVAGERRFHACKLAGLSEVPVKIVRTDRRTLLQIQLVENLQREDLTPLETAAALRDLIERRSITQGELAAGIGWSRTAVTNKIRLLSLPKEVIDLLAEGKLTEGHARVLLALTSSEKIKEFAHACVKNDLSVKALADRIERASQKKKSLPSAPYKALRPKGVAPLQKKLGFKIGAASNGKNCRVVLHGLTNDQVERLMRVLKKSAAVLNPPEGKRAKKS